MISITRTSQSACLHCGKKLDAISSLGDGEVPIPGDVTVCLYCGAIMKIGKDLCPAPFTDEEVNDMLADRELMRYLRRVAGRIYWIKHQKG
jgi:hypothetical protein